MEPLDEFAKWLVSLGVGGAIAALIFTFYRKDVKMYTELWKIATDQLIAVIKENTASNVKLISLIEAQERNSIRKGDIEALIDKRMRERLIELSWPKTDKEIEGQG